MRLINTRTLELVEFFAEEEIPPYAILSHTWGSTKDEVSFQGWQTLAREEKPGFKKIKYCCRQAREDGLKWVWVDT